MKFEEISKSYEWTGTRNTFPANWWSDILMDYLHAGMRTKQLETKYRTTLEKASKTNKSSNNMYISVLLNRLLIMDSRGSLKKSDISSCRNAINKYVTEIINDAVEKYKIANNWKIQINRWNEYLAIFNNKSSDNFQMKNAPTFIKNTVSKIREVNYKFEDINKKYNTSDYDDNSNLEIKEDVGKVGEEIIYNMLVKKYGFDNVVQTRKFDKYAAYDFEVNVEESKKYIEVKSSMKRNNINWYISRREYEFYKQNSSNYILYFVKNVYISKDISANDFAFVEKCVSPKIEINNKIFGILGKEKKYLVTPIKYKGIA